VGINKALVVDGLFLAGTTALCGLFLNVIYWMTGDSFAGEPMTLEVARSMPEFHLEGRTVFFRENLPAYFLTGRSGIGVLHLSGFIVITALMGFVLKFRQLEIPTLSCHLIWTSLVLFILAHLVLFRLYLPSRYTYYTLSLALLLIIGANLRPFMDRLKDAVPRLWDVAGRIPKGVKGAVAAALLLAYILAQSFLICRIDPRLVVLDSPDLEMLHFLQTLPKDSLVAGHPNVMDNVPLVARRKVVANTELALPYYTGYYNWIKPRLADSLRAYYAADEKQLRAFLDGYGVNALVVRRSHFDKAFLDGVITYEPFNTEIKKRLGKNPEFVLSPAPRKDRCFENERYVVLCFPEKN
jgi:hypothetical protein